MTTFTGQVAAIRGASSGIGKAIAHGLAAQGATLCLFGRRLEILKAIAEETQATAPQFECYRVDLTWDEDIRELTARLEHDFGALDVLIHSVGVYSIGRVETARGENFDWQYRTNVRAPFMFMQALLPLLSACQGQMVFINSSVGLRARANLGQYATTKHALKARADSLREEVNADGVCVLSVFIGRTATPTQAAIHEMEGRAYHPQLLIQSEGVAAVVINALNLSRNAEVTDMKIRPWEKWELEKLPETLTERSTVACRSRRLKKTTTVCVGMIWSPISRRSIMARPFSQSCSDFTSRETSKNQSTWMNYYGRLSDYIILYIFGSSLISAISGYSCDLDLP
jgi:NADP-dependent 3-hydroxy acid dehydrogenase YdfG